jgi:hypothetical protein
MAAIKMAAIVARSWLDPGSILAYHERVNFFSDTCR